MGWGGGGLGFENAIFEHKVSIINLCNKTIVKTYGTAYVHMQYCSCFFVSILSKQHVVYTFFVQNEFFSQF